MCVCVCLSVCLSVSQSACVCALAGVCVCVCVCVWAFCVAHASAGRGVCLLVRNHLVPLVWGLLVCSAVCTCSNAILTFPFLGPTRTTAYSQVLFSFLPPSHGVGRTGHSNRNQERSCTSMRSNVLAGASGSRR
jgi:hypothetical protein